MPSFFKMNELVSRAAYTAVVLDEHSRAALFDYVPSAKEWSKIAHHMTINMGPAANGPAAAMLGQKSILTTQRIGYDNKVVAVQVETIVPSTNAIKHVTIAVNRSAGGKPYMSNHLTNWVPMDSIVLHGIVAECDVNGNVINEF